MDEIAIGVINSIGYTLDSIVDARELIPLREIESTQWGGVDENLSQDIHPENLDIAIRAAELFNIEVAGVDIISTDITKPWYENGAIINEVNTSPLLGGNEFSKSKIPFYVKNIINGDGRIPISVIVGGSLAWEMAKKIQKKKIKNSIRCFITSHKETLNFEKQKMFFEFNTLYERCQALLLNSNVDELILIVQTDEFLYAGLPVDKIDEVVIDSKNLVEYKDNNKKLTEHRYNTLLKLLKSV